MKPSALAWATVSGCVYEANLPTISNASKTFASSQAVRSYDINLLNVSCPTIEFKSPAMNASKYPAVG